MAKFTLKQGSDSFDFDVFGAVKDKNDGAIGVWTTDKNNKILVKKSDGTDLLFPVDWKFNDKNQLCVLSGGAEVFNFNKSDANRPIYKTVDAVLIVKPHRDNLFVFNLRGTWEMTGDHDLSITINNVKSVIDGFLQDPTGRFMYHFFNKEDPTFKQESILGFVGGLNPSVDEGGKHITVFNYRKEGDTQGKFSGAFNLPEGLTVHRNFNQFMYEYDKKGRTTQLVITGEMTLTDNFQMKYIVAQQKSSGQEQVSSTTFILDLELKTKKFTGDLEFSFKKVNGKTAGASSLEIGVSGQYTAVLGSARLQAAYSFVQTKGNNTSSFAFGFNGSLAFKNGEFVWNFQKNAQETSISVMGNITVGGARIDERLNILVDLNHKVGVQLLFGVAF